MRGKNRVDLITKQLQIIDALCGETPTERLCDRINAVQVVYGNDDFEEQDLYIELPYEWINPLVALLNESKIECTEVESKPEDAVVIPCPDQLNQKNRKRWMLLRSKPKKKYGIIKTKLKSEKLYYLISDIEEYGERDVKVEVMVVDTSRCE